MVFSSPIFLFLFLPIVLGGYFITPNRFKNAFLLAVSLVFYLVGAGIYIALLLFSITTNYWFGKQIANNDGKRQQCWWLATAILINLIPLLVFKYEGFLAGLTNQILSGAGLKGTLPVFHLFLPAGISFFTFQGLAYIIDVSRGTIQPSRSLINFGLFKAFFPQLVAGPIVRYSDLAADLIHRRHSLDQVVRGLERFGLGLAKKVLIADNLGRVADTIFNASPTEWSAPNAWLGLVCYTLQIFFDFSGYSDMAIGLGRIFALSLPENFRQPYTAVSVTDFWRRWHMTLSRFFRDYLYIPLGGNRHGNFRTAINLLIVFALCGLWHGANVTFLIWGLYHGALLIVERLLKRIWGFEPHGIAGLVYTLLAVMFGWVFFRSPTFPQAGKYFSALLGRNHVSPTFPLAYHLTSNVAVYLTAGLVVALWPDQPGYPHQFEDRSIGWRPWLAVTVMAWAMIAQSPESFNPFIYFQF